MPSPVFHSLVGITVFSKWRRFERSGNVWIMLMFLLISSLPDIDLLFGFLVGNVNLYHHQFTHSIMFCILMAPVIGGILALFKISGFWRNTAYVFVLLISHLLLDAVTLDTKEPLGQPLFWPFSDVFVRAPFTIFLDIRRVGESSQFVQSLFSAHNFWAVFVECIIFSPFCIWLAMKWNKRKEVKVSSV